MTTSAAVGLKLTADRSEISADGQDLAFVTVEAVDHEGRLQMNADQQVHVTIEGPGAIAGLGNGDGKSTASYQGDTVILSRGRGVIVVRSSKRAGKVQLTAAAPGLSRTSLVLTSWSIIGAPELN